MGKSLVSYQVMRIGKNNSKSIKGTLQKLIDILNMQAGDQKFIGEKNYNSDNRIKDQRFLNVNTYPIKEIMELDILL